MKNTQAGIAVVASRQVHAWSYTLSSTLLQDSTNNLRIYKHMYHYLKYKTQNMQVSFRCRRFSQKVSETQHA